jgi:cytochrome c556
MKRLIAAAALLAVGIASAAADPIADRRALMKSMAEATKTGAALAKGDMPFDAAKASGVLEVYIDVSQKLPTLFPEDSKTGGDTTASPKIWEDMAGFKATAAKIGAEAKAAQATSVDQASFASNFGEVTKNCGACHGTYRIKKG